MTEFIPRCGDAEKPGISRDMYSTDGMGREMTEPIVLESNQNHATITNNGICPSLTASMGDGRRICANDCDNEEALPRRSIAYGVITKGNGEVIVTAERHTSLSTGGGQAGQGYPCVLIIATEEKCGNEI